MSEPMRYLYLALLLMCSSVAVAQPDPSVWQTYHDYASLTRELKRLRSEHPDLVALSSIGKTVQGRDIWLVTVSSANPSRAKREVLFDAGFHGSEVVGPEVMLRYAKWLVQHPDATARKILDGWVTYVIPMVNADGVEAGKGQKVGKKARKNAHGVDLNRNFDWDWDKAGSSTLSADSYRGPSVFSEPESRAVRDFILSKRNLALYLDGHSGTDKGPYLITPSANPDAARFDEIAKVVSDAGGYRRVKSTKSGEGYLWAYWKAFASQRAAGRTPLAMLLEVYTVGTVPVSSPEWWTRYNPPTKELDAVAEKVRKVLVALTLCSVK
jgi:hypothetical protein